MNKYEFKDIADYSRSQLEIYLTYYVILNGLASRPQEIEYEVLRLMEEKNNKFIKLYELDSNVKGRTKLGYNLAWARTFLKQNGLITNPKRGYWEPTDFGKSNLLDFDKKTSSTIQTEKKDFRINSLIVRKEKEMAVNLNFFNENVNKNQDSYFSILLGKNSSGKSFLLRIINRVFVYLEKLKVYKYRTRYLDYSYLEMSYTLNSIEFKVILDGEENILIYRNDAKVTIFDIEIPQKVIALSYNLNDKFLTLKKGESQRYIYKGCRKLTDNFYQTSIFESLERIVEKGMLEELREVLSFLDYSDQIIFEFDSISKKGNFGNINMESSGDMIELSHANLNKITDCKKSKELVNIYLIDNRGEMQEIDDLSSGEKQILFTFLTLLANMEVNSLIMIEEPENSLHPSWQKKIIPVLTQLLENKNLGIQIIIATHSPFLTGDIRPENSSVIVSRKNKKKVTYEPLEFSTYAWSVENILYQVFEMETTRNYYIDGDMQRIIYFFSESDYKDSITENELYESFKRIFSVENLTEDDPLNIFKNRAKEMLPDKSANLYEKLIEYYEF